MNSLIKNTYLTLKKNFHLDSTTAFAFFYIYYQNSIKDNKKLTNYHNFFLELEDYKNNFNDIYTYSELEHFLKHRDPVEKDYIVHTLLNYAQSLTLEELSELLNYIFNEIKNDSNKFECNTPISIVLLVEKLLNINSNDDVADLCSGYCSFLFHAIKNTNGNSYVGIEKEITKANVTRIISKVNNLNAEIKNIDLFNLNYSIKFSKIFCEPPFSSKLDFYNSLLFKYLQFGLNKRAGESFYILRGLEHLKENGRMIFCVPTGFLTSPTHFTLRKYLTNQKYLEAVIQLTNNLLTYSGISISLIIISKKANDSVMFINADSIYTKNRLNKNELTIDNVEEIYSHYKEESNCSKKVSFETISENNYDFSPIKYLEDLVINYANSNIVKYEKLNNLCEISRGIQISAKELDNVTSKKKTGIQYLNLSGIENNQIIHELPNLSEIQENQKKYSLQENDFVLSMAIKFPLKCAVATNLKDKIILVASNLYIIRPNTSKILPGYLKALFESEETFNILKSFSSGSLTHALPIELLKEIKIPLPSLEEQKSFISSYNDIDEKINMLRKEIEELTENKKDYLLKYFNK